MKRKPVVPKADGLRVTRKIKGSLSEAVVTQILSSIAKGELQPGQRLPAERDLCIRFGIARSSLREALRCLAILGVINARVGGGTTVAANGGKFLQKILQWRMLTERHDLDNLMEVRLAMERVAVANVATYGSQEQIQELDRLVAAMGEVVSDRSRFLALDLQFHVTLAGHSGNPLLSDLISIIRGHTARAISRVLLSPDAIMLSHKEHSRLMTMIRRRDPEGARKAIETHLNNAVFRYEKAHPETADDNGRVLKTKRRGRLSYAVA